MLAVAIEWDGSSAQISKKHFAKANIVRFLNTISTILSVLSFTGFLLKNGKCFVIKFNVYNTLMLTFATS